jgi:hypothetical protein
MTVYIPNINSVATLIDRLTVENVKLSFFVEQSKTPNLDIDMNKLNEKIAKQELIKNEVQNMLFETLEEIFLKMSYQPLFEERTFS